MNYTIFLMGFEIKVYNYAMKKYIWTGCICCTKNVLGYTNRPTYLLRGRKPTNNYTYFKKLGNPADVHFIADDDEGF